MNNGEKSGNLAAHCNIICIFGLLCFVAKGSRADSNTLASHRPLIYMHVTLYVHL